MQKKWILAIALVAIASAGIITTVVSDDNESDGSSDTVTYFVAINQGSERVLNIIINENYFELAGTSHIINWEYRDSSQQVFTAFSVGDEISVPSKYSFELTDDPDIVGQYELKLKALTEGRMTATLSLSCTIDVVLVDSVTSQVSYRTETLYIVINMSLNDGAVLPSVIAYRLDNGEEESIGGVELNEGAPVTMTPILDNEALVGELSDYYWYAVNLPSGLAMTKNGIIAGIPVEHNTTSVIEATVFVEDGYGTSDSFQINFTIKVNESRDDISYYLFNDTFTSTTEFSTGLHSPTQFITQRDRVVSFVACPTYNEVSGQFVHSIGEISIVSYSGEGSGELNREKITVIDYDDTELNKVTNGLQNYYSVQIPTDGSGFYRVMIYDKNGALADTFDFYVMSKLLAVESAIIVGCDSSS